MAIQNPFRMPGRWYKGNTHSHSTESDGQLSVPERFGAYRDQGYDFLVLTDHGKVSDVSGYTEQGFLAISGSELHPPSPYGGDTYHIVGINVHEPIDTRDQHPNETIAAIRSQGGEAVLCHPYWSGHTLLDHTPLSGYFAVEVYNDTCMAIGKGFAEEAWDNLLDATDRPVYGLAVDDAHTADRDCFHGWIQLKAEELTVEAVLRSLTSGAFYSSMGPQLHDVSLDTAADGSRRLSVTCSPASSIAFLCQRSRGGRILAGDDGPLTTGTYDVPSEAAYVRVEITDDRGRKAWSNPFFFRTAPAD